MDGRHMSYLHRKLRRRSTPAVITVPRITREEAERLKDEWTRRTHHAPPIILSGDRLTYYPAQRQQQQQRQQR
jgi:hypothetical protein